MIISESSTANFLMTSDKAGYLYLMPPAAGEVSGSSLGSFQQNDAGLTGSSLSYTTQAPFLLSRHPRSGDSSCGRVHDEIHTVLWLFGRGLSLSCGLDWDDLMHCRQLSRDEKIQCIKEKLPAAMNAPGVNREPIRDFLKFLLVQTLGRWRHRFMTTNWDYLLQQEIDKLVPDSVPDCLYPTTQVFHMNGTVEVSENRNPIVLRDDKKRTPSQELNEAIGHLAWASIFVIVGMSFECEPDKALFNVLNSVEDMLPVGESNWIIVNPCSADLENAHYLVKRKLPQASVTPVPHTLTFWREVRFPQLRERRVFS